MEFDFDMKIYLACTSSVLPQLASTLKSSTFVPEAKKPKWCCHFAVLASLSLAIATASGFAGNCHTVQLVEW